MVSVSVVVPAATSSKPCPNRVSRSRIAMLRRLVSFSPLSMAARRASPTSIISNTPTRPEYPAPSQRSQPTASKTLSGGAMSWRLKCPASSGVVSREVRQSSHNRRNSRCAMTPRNVAAIKKSSSPRSRNRTTAPTDPLACSEENTRCPVNAACAATLAVSPSLISPTRMTSGSCRSVARNPLAKVMPISALICDWLMPCRSYSIGSSTVTMLRSSRLASCNRE
mmetsp:Transcript_23988/g.43910  ORF Transcript_23988/g.43910 Transcript_23988/m.43910 type:complete len:224 (+) Transcript_23988:8149-8820(+)